MAERVGKGDGPALGQCVFGTRHGIQAVGSGYLRTLPSNVGLVEFRGVIDNKTLQDESVRVAYRMALNHSNYGPLELVGIVQGSTDSVGRVGFIGAGIAVPYLDRSAYLSALTNSATLLDRNKSIESSDWNVTPEATKQSNAASEANSSTRGRLEVKAAEDNNGPLALRLTQEWPDFLTASSEVIAQVTWVASGADQAILVTNQALQDSLSADWKLVSEIRSIKEEEHAESIKGIERNYRGRIEKLEEERNEYRERVSQRDDEIAELKDHIAVVTRERDNVRKSPFGPTEIRPRNELSRNGAHGTEWTYGKSSSGPPSHSRSYGSQGGRVRDGKSTGRLRGQRGERQRSLSRTFMELIKVIGFIGFGALFIGAGVWLFWLGVDRIVEWFFE